MKSAPGRGGLVYSTELGRTCPGCRQAVADCACRAGGTVAAPTGAVTVSMQTQGRRAKGVTLVAGLALDAAALAQLARRLKAACGVGGTSKDGVIELQGDQRERLIELLRADGWVVKRAGG